MKLNKHRRHYILFHQVLRKYWNPCIANPWIYDAVNAKAFFTFEDAEAEIKVRGLQWDKVEIITVEP